jgi:hypothetical protein
MSHATGTYTLELQTAPVPYTVTNYTFIPNCAPFRIYANIHNVDTTSAVQVCCALC